MRMVFGLVSLLVVLGIMMLVFKMFEAPDIEQGHQAQQQAEQISGRDANGVPAYKSYQGQEYDLGTTFKGIKITDLTAGGPMDTAYGLKVGDIVTQIGGLDAVTLGGYDSAKGQLDEAYQHAASLTVIRDGQQVTLQCKNALNGLIPGN
jgi:C-terminal processing protease CtpA/Prc